MRALGDVDVPFAVSQWPNSPDPRLANFNFVGWDYGQVPPWQWIIKTTGATFPFDIFNSGVLVEPTGFLPEDTVFEQVNTLPGGVTVVLSIKGIVPPIGPPPGFTKSMGILVRESGVDKFGGGYNALWPTAIQIHGPFPMVNLNITFGTIPNPMTITPAKWNLVWP